MALIKCSGCQKLFSDQANKCPYCKGPETADKISVESKFFLSAEGLKLFLFAFTLLMLFIGNNIYNGPYHNKVIAEKRWSFWGWEKPSAITCKILMWKVDEEFKNDKDEKKLLSYEDVYLVSQDDQRLECMARATFADGREGNHKFYVEYQFDDKLFAPTRSGYFLTNLGWREL